MKLASRTHRVGPSPTLGITATAKTMAAQGIEVCNFGAGEPACDTPDFIKAAAIEAIQAGFTKYTPVTGTEELKSAIVDKFQHDQGVAYEKSQIVVSCGAKHTLYNLAQALCDAGDEVIIPTPYWVSYPDIVRLADATPVFLDTDESKGYAIDPQALEQSLSPRTKALILNSPCNPTGAMYNRETLEAIASIALRHKITIISDEIYEKICYDQIPFLSILSVAPELQAQTILVNGVSKAFAMTGWRIGYAAGPQDLMTAMGHIQSQSTSNPTSIAQKAATAGLRGDESFFAELIRDLEPKRALMVKQLNTIPGIHCPNPSGAFYAFPNVKELLGRRHAEGVIATPTDLAAYLLKEARVACIPGEPFGSANHLRLSYTTELPIIQKGLERIGQAISGLR
ncbi:MAG: aminotransferase class I/II-fold pyridoxal phosphate-dependent enzyme [Nitrospirales bacterium]|nr:aminotransferase class I/II-fold pyridoxal phosphate-dependent enzyme [Nitrospirales bacterium]